MTRNAIRGALALLVLAGATSAIAGPRSDVPAKPKPAAPAKKLVAAKKPVSAKKRVVKKRTPVQMAPTRDRITEIQAALAGAGSYQGEATGQWDIASTQAMMRFQSSHGLAPTGKINALTLGKLGLGAETAGRGAPVARLPGAAASGDSASTP